MHRPPSGLARALISEAGFPTTEPQQRRGSHGLPCPARFMTLAGFQSPIFLLASLPLPSANPPLSALWPPLGCYFRCETKLASRHPLSLQWWLEIDVALCTAGGKPAAASCQETSLPVSPQTHEASLGSLGVGKAPPEGAPHGRPSVVENRGARHQHRAPAPCLLRTRPRGVCLQPHTGVFVLSTLTFTPTSSHGHQSALVTSPSRTPGRPLEHGEELSKRRNSV